ncbi:MAG: potassium channel family protein [Bacteroidota bacterium]
MENGRFAVIGLGQFGQAIAKALAGRGAEVLAIDSDPEVVDDIADRVAYAVAMDATDKKALIANDITDFDAVIVTIGQDFEQLVLCTVVLMELGAKRIIARAQGKNTRTILEKMGVREILSPEDEVGVIVAERLTNPGLVSYLQLPDEYRVAEIIAPPNVEGRRLEELDLRDNYNLSLITIKRLDPGEQGPAGDMKHHITGVPISTTVIEKDDYLIIFGKNKDLQRFIEINQ